MARCRRLLVLALVVSAAVPSAASAAIDLTPPFVSGVSATSLCYTRSEAYPSGFLGPFLNVSVSEPATIRIHALPVPGRRGGLAFWTSGGSSEEDPVVFSRAVRVSVPRGRSQLQMGFPFSWTQTPPGAVRIAPLVGSGYAVFLVEARDRRGNVGLPAFSNVMKLGQGEAFGSGGTWPCVGAY
ncbi:MAG: hypothetical protein JHC95_17435 [Solirubrobacteraceae bacterium]|nr:hypothetical protein [Solirubrobacteraceae bacterium]